MPSSNRPINEAAIIEQLATSHYDSRVTGH
jgi:hypothetical protein